MKSFFKGSVDERIKNQIYSYGYKAFLLISILLFLDFMIKIYVGKDVSEYISTAVIFFIGILYYAIRNFIGKVPLGIYKVEKNKTNQNILNLISVVVIIIGDILVKKPMVNILFDAISWLIFLNIVLFVFNKINDK